ncbi:DUF4302 domain-containing protein [Mucilaginibacter paludis]|uniref:DUF4302 domain-containing protein n=1 Tax=Mucilaginibacter paludis DSM 18603 TaxID=714943 RepID=H1YCY6_9SPHI|nr:DUF4302 domain-containing protein [Mucilaginibacter paludis]EHQ25157.1 hypothetical protein Mucpa_0983 [Mucilaginibacter paludis DSM 18603]
MKKYLYLSALAFTCFTACKKDSLTKIPLEKSFDDQNPVVQKYQATITAGDGWKATFNTAKGTMYNGFFKFETTGDSKFVLDYSSASAATVGTAKYTATVYNTNPTLALSSTSAFGTIASVKSLGIDTSFTFKYASATGDTVKLVGNSYGCGLTLVKIAKAEGDNYLAGQMATAMTSVANLNKFRAYYKRATINGKNYDLIFNTKAKVLTINYSSAGVFQRFVAYYSYTPNGVMLSQPFVDGTLTFSTISALQVDLPSFTATATAGTSSVAINNATTPVAIDLTSAKRFEVTIVPITNYWISYYGFTIDGVPDALNVSGIIPTFNFIAFYTKYNASYDRVGFWANGAVGAYGPAVVPTYPTDGRLVCTYFGSFGTSTVPAVATVVNAVRDRFIDAQGYYVFQTGPSSYDWVSVATGRTWISFE